MAEKQEAITTIDVTANLVTTQVESSKPKSTEKPEIVGIISKAKPEPKFWNLGKHLLYCGYFEAVSRYCNVLAKLTYSKLEIF